MSIDATSSRLLRCGLPALFLLAAVPGAPAAGAPPWWVSRNVVDTNAPARDYAVANLGQLKWFATKACDELEWKLPGGAGSNLWQMVGGFSLSNNYAAVNLGQLKYVASAVYDRLIAEGYTNAYPWTTNTTDDVNYAAANLGQLKNVFSFDLQKDTDGDDLADWVEKGTGIYIGPYNTGSSATNSDTDADGRLDGAEVAARTDPNDGDTVLPVIGLEHPQQGAVVWFP